LEKLAVQNTPTGETAGRTPSPVCVVDLDRGESQVVELQDSSKARVKLIEVQEPFAPRTRVSLRESQWLINDEVTCRGARAEGLLMNVRMVNSVFEDRRKPDFDPEANTDRFLARVPEYAAHGVRAFTLCLQGGMPGYEGALNSAFAPDGSLRKPYLARVRRVIEACDRQGLVVILGCFYQRQDQVLADEAAVRAGVVNVANWIRRCGFGNVALEIANEFDHGGFDHRLLRTVDGEIELIRLAKKTVPGLLVSASGLGHGRYPDKLAEAADFLLIHFNGTQLDDIPIRIAALKKFGKPIVCNEDDKQGVAAARAAELCVANGASWGLMLKAVNQYFPLAFHGAADDPVVYAKLKELASPRPKAGSLTKEDFPPSESGRSRGAAEKPKDVFPGVDWIEASPESQGIDSEKLRAAVELLDKTVGQDGARELVIVRHGRLVWKGPDADKVHGVWSLTKSFTSTVLGLLIDDGKCTLDTRAADIVPDLATHYPDATLRHFTTMTSGYRALGDEPRGSYKHGPSGTPFLPNPQPLFRPAGSQYAYWDSAMNEFGLVLTRPAGEPLEAIFRRRIAGPIGMNPERWRWGVLSTNQGLAVNGGSGNANKHVFISAREAARLGLLFLNRGNWAGRQLLSARWVEQATRVQVLASLPWAHPESEIDGRGCYGFNWWTNGLQPDGRRKLPRAPAGTFWGSGHNNNKLFVIPEWNMVIARLGLDGRAPDQVWNDFLAKVGQALAGQPAGDCRELGREQRVKHPD
ncbi:MAG: serine hydrolase, partial [Chloroflexi bacterium]|nr:serine hydrolase [Chloroflexota bacterium]